MKKIIFILLFIITNVTASQLYDKIENLVGKYQFQLHNKLINNLFKVESAFYIKEDKLDYKSILKTLKENGLLRLKFKKPTIVNIKFTISNNPIKSFKILNEILRGMGYSYYFTKSSEYDKKTDKMVWKIDLKVEYAVDPFILVQELNTISCEVLNITKKNNISWEYDIDFALAIIEEAIKIENNEKVVLQKPLKAYFIKVGDIEKIRIISRKLNHWFPYITFYDEHLSVLKVIKKERTYKGYGTNVPHGTMYIKISDLYTLLNIKRGLSIIVK